MKKLLKNIAKSIIIMSTVVLSILSFNKAINELKGKVDFAKYDNEVREYIVNKRSKKIHINTCASVDRMSERNKSTKNDTLINLINDGYIVCNNCNAGRKISKSLIEKIKNNIFTINEEEIEKTLSSYEEYIKAINIVGEWYINHIPTYQTELEEMKLSEYIGTDTYINEIELDNKIHGKYNKNVLYKQITSSGNNQIKNYNDDTIVLKANEKAVNNYKDNYKNISFKKDTAYYPCEYLKNSQDSYKKAGDDCVRFIFSCMNAMNNNFTKYLVKSSGIKWSHINSSMFANNNKMFAYALKTMGFEIFDKKQVNIDINKDNITDGKINVISSDFKLQKGDILATKGHVHIYLDDNFGIDVKNFGWGKVNYLFPQLSDCSLEYIVSEGYEIKCNGMNFTRVYRYIGKEKEEDK